MDRCHRRRRTRRTWSGCESIIACTNIVVEPGQCLPSTAAFPRNADSRQYYYASNILLFLSLAASKCSIALLIITIQPDKRIGYAFYALMGLVVVWAIAAVFVTAFQCGPNRWVLGPTDTDTCIDQLSAQIAIRAVDIVTDIILAISPAFMMIKVQMSMDKRLVVALMFGLRLAYV